VNKDDNRALSTTAYDKGFMVTNADDSLYHIWKSVTAGLIEKFGYGTHPIDCSWCANESIPGFESESCHRKTQRGSTAYLPRSQPNVFQESCFSHASSSKAAYQPGLSHLLHTLSHRLKSSRHFISKPPPKIVHYTHDQDHSSKEQVEYLDQSNYTIGEKDAVLESRIMPGKEHLDKGVVRKLIRKVDLRLMPALGLFYAFSLTD
jgi:hypothetical protein